MFDPAPIRLMKKVRKTLSDENRWVKGSPAARADGTRCDMFDKDAYKFCLAGALAHHRTKMWCVDMADKVRASNLLVDVIRSDTKKYNCWVTAFNDDPKTTHKDVLNILDKAIAKGVVLHRKGNKP